MPSTTTQSIALSAVTGPKPLPPFPVEVLPDPAARMASDLARSMSVSPDMTAIACLGAMTACTSGRFTVKVDSDWHVGASVYLLVMRGSGSKKSPAMKLVYRALRETQAELYLRWQGMDKDDRGPSPRVMIRGNATGEGLGLHWQATGGKAHICDSEGAWWSILAGRYSKNPTWDEILSGWDGDTYEVIRAGRPSFVIEEAWLSLCTLVQPEALSDLAAIPAAKDLGIMGRILAAAPPDVPVDVRSPSVDRTTLEVWGRWISACALTYWAMPEPHSIGMTPDARELLYDVQERYLADAADEGPLAEHQSWAAKAAGHVVALAAIVSRCEKVSLGYGQPLNATDLAVGISIMDYFAAQTPHCHPGPPDPTAKVVAKITPWIHRQTGSWSRADAWRANRSTGHASADIQPALDRLVDLGELTYEGTDERRRTYAKVVPDGS